MSWTSPRYDPRWATTQENFNPHRSNPLRYSVCMGASPDFALPTYPSWNPNEDNIAGICAKSQYWGHPFTGGPLRVLETPISMQAFCEARPDPDYPEGPEATSVNIGTAFDFWWLGPLRKPAVELYLRLALYCRERCFCVNYPELTPRRPKAAGNARIVRMPLHNTMRVTLDTVPEFPGKPVKFDESHTELVLATTIREVSQVDLDLNRPAEQVRMEKFHVSLDPANRITCDDVEVPQFLRNMPEPFTIDDFPNAQSICAVALSGGDPRANAGGYCHRRHETFPTRGGPRIVGQVWFAEEMTPRSEWAWNGWSLNWVLSLRYFCWKTCRCDSYPRDTGDDYYHLGARVWPLGEETRIIKDRTGALHLLKQDDGGQYSFVKLAPEPHKDPDQVKEESKCAPGEVQGSSEACPLATWNTTVLGAKPRRAPFRERDVLTQKSSALSCGAECTGPAAQTCAGAIAGEEGCKCVLPSARLAARLGLDPVAPKAMCLAMYKLRPAWGEQKKPVLAMLGLAASVGSLLGKRDGDGEEGAREWDWGGCVCNVTYVSKKCCHARDGMVWEEEGLRTGQLVR